MDEINQDSFFVLLDDLGEIVSHSKYKINCDFFYKLQNQLSYPYNAFKSSLNKKNFKDDQLIEVYSCDRILYSPTETQNSTALEILFKYNNFIQNNIIDFLPNKPIFCDQSNKVLIKNK